MRIIILTILASMAFLSPKAQTALPAGSLNYAAWPAFSGYSSFSPVNLGHKWYVSKYAGLSAGSVFAARSGSSFLSVPVGLQFSYQLTKNLYPFAGVSVAPTVFSFNRLLTDPRFNASFPGHNPYSFGLNSRVEAGLMYVNDAKTFSISGSIGIEKGSYPVYPPGRADKRKQ